jgi:hypothetical protein
MRELRGNLWELPADWRCITTNGYVRTDGACVMGRGCAREAKQRFPQLPYQLGALLRQPGGNRLHVFPEHGLLTFPVKHAWMEPADPALIATSAAQLTDFAALQPDKTFLLPRPGCGNGQLTWEQVRPLLEGLPDNVMVVTF